MFFKLKDNKKGPVGPFLVWNMLSHLVRLRGNFDDLPRTIVVVYCTTVLGRAVGSMVPDVVSYPSGSNGSEACKQASEQAIAKFHWGVAPLLLTT